MPFYGYRPRNILFVILPVPYKTGLFFGDQLLTSGTSSFTMPDGTTCSTSDCTATGTPLSSLWSDAISVSAPLFGQLEQTYQADTKKVGPAGNPNYVANSLSEGPNGDSIYAPNFRTTRSIQINIGVQREVWKGGIFSADYIRNVGEHIQQSIDKNLDGAASTLNPANAVAAINATLAACGATTIDAAIQACPGLHATGGATIADFAGNGLDSGKAFASGSPAPTAAFPGINPLFGQMNFNYPLGRSVYNGLQTNLRQSARVPLPGLRKSGFEVSYALSKFVSSGGADQNFTPASVDNINPLGFVGPAGTDRTHQLSYGGSFEWLGGFTTSIIGHYYSALPTTLTLNTPNGANGPGEIFSTDLTGDGTTGDILPGYKSGAFMRSVKPGALSSVIANYNATGAGKLTPAGQALVSATNPNTNGPLFTAAELTALGAVTRTVAAPPAANAGNGNLRTFDLTFGRPTHLRWLGEGTTIEPTFSAFNLFNLSNFGTYSAANGVLDTTQLAGTVNGTDTSYNGGDSFNRNAMRNGNGSGVFSQGAARVLEYGLKFNF